MCACRYVYFLISLEEIYFIKQYKCQGFSIIYSIICLISAQLYEELALDKATEEIKLRVSRDYASGVDTRCSLSLISVCFQTINNLPYGLSLISLVKLLKTTQRK